MSADETPDRGGGAQRWLGWLTSSTVFYLLAFVLTTGLALAMFNPHWGAVAEAWPHQVFEVDGAFAWTPTAARAATLFVAIVALVIALLWRPGRTRGAIALLGTGVALVAFEPAPTELATWILPLATATVGGALLVRGGGRTRQAVLLVGLAILATDLFMPWSETRVMDAHLEPGYHSTATVQIHQLIHPDENLLHFLPETGGDEGERRPVEGYLRILIITLPHTAALVMLLLGLIALAGLAGRWVPWVVGPLLILLTLLPAWLFYDAGHALPMRPEGVVDWQMGLRHWATIWPQRAIAWMLPLAGAIAELTRPRDA